MAGVLHHGRRVGVTVEGAVLEAQFEVDGAERAGERFVLMLTHDCPYEERLSIYLFDAAFRTLDRVEICHIYTPGILSNVAADRHAIEFDFIHEQRCRVRVHDKPCWRRRPFAPIGITQPGGPLRKHWLEAELLERA